VATREQALVSPASHPPEAVAARRSSCEERDDLVEDGVEDRTQAVAQTRVGHQSSAWQTLRAGTLQQVEARERIGFAGEEQDGRPDVGPVCRPRLPVRLPGTMEGIAEADQRGDAAAGLRREKAGHAASIGLAADDELGRRLGQLLDAGPVDGHGRLGLADREVDGHAVHAAPRKAGHMTLHGRGVSGARGR
jgi:hypothetical protein